MLHFWDTHNVGGLSMNPFGSDMKLLFRRCEFSLECSKTVEGTESMFNYKMLNTKAVFVIGLFILLSVATQAAAQGRSAQGLARAQEVKERHVQDLIERLGVVGAGVGLDQNGDAVIKIAVETEAETAKLPQFLDGVPVVAKVTGKIVAMDCLNGTNQWDPTARCDRPVPIGVSTGHPLVTAGTIGARVKDSSGNVYALSNNHVYAAENQGNKKLDPV